MNPGQPNCLNRQDITHYRGCSMMARWPTDLTGESNGAAIANRELKLADNNILGLVKVLILVHMTGGRPPCNLEFS